MRAKREEARMKAFGSGDFYDNHEIRFKKMMEEEDER
jgi:hypothetical protein